MGENAAERRSGCGLLSVMFGRRNLWSKKPTPTDNGSQKSTSTAATATSNIQFTKSPGST
ncbi:hypothetical protein HID58_095286 [Brassica napus]|uniref:Uncharacterized protein n=1 Tax=Brassica napus TaxID=3708 RepID=A0ABQ7X498_BRANA|nr:hypothetical protein HID58_095286 [Brassica napus]